MPSLAQLTDAYIQPDTGLPVEPLYVPNKEDAISVRPVVDDRPEPMPEIAGSLDEPTFSKGTKIGNKLFGLNGEERYQTWPEKVLREGLSAAGDVMANGTLPPGLRREDFTDIPAPQMPTQDSTWLGNALGVAPVAASPADSLIEKAQAVAALAGTGGLAGADATLGSAPFLRPALKYENKIYKAPLNGQHLDALPSHLAEEFNRQAMSGEDISNFNFGFMNHKGQFLDRQAALDYAIKEGLVDPHAGQYGALTSTLLADSSKPGTAIEAMAKTNPADVWWHGSASGDLRGGSSGLHLGTQEAAKQALEARIGIPADGKGWTGDREYGKTLLAGQDTLAKLDPKGYNKTGYNIDVPKEDFYPSKTLKYPDGSEMPLTVKPEVAPYKIVGNMSNSRQSPHEDFKANGYMKGQLKKGTAKNGYYYKNVGEDEGSISAVVPNGSHVVRLKSDNEAGAGIAAMKQAQPFYSALEHNVDKITQSKMTGDQWLGTLANKPGVKPEELQWTGTQDFLKERGNQPVTKAELQEHLQGNKVELKEVNKGELKFNKTSPYALPEVVRAVKQSGENPGELELTLANDGDAYRALTKKFPHLSEDEDWAAKVAKSVFGGDTMPSGTTKFHDTKLSLPGGENYREMLLTTPTANDKYIKAVDIMKAKYGDKPLAQMPMTDAEKAYIDKQINAYGDNGGAYKSSHWDEPNILAHVRMNDRVMSEQGYSVQNVKSGNKSQVFASEAEAKAYQAKLPATVQTKIVSDTLPKKSLHLEEIQSDWHQQGRDKGYKLSQSERARVDEIIAAGDKVGGVQNLPQSIQDEAKALSQRMVSDAPPDAPFKKSWHELALKRMIREAAEKGYDRLSWTPGEAQAARYDLSKQVNLISGMKQPNGKYLTYIEGKDNQPLFRNRDGFSDNGQKELTPNQLQDIVGKEAADKIVNGKPNKDGWVDLRDDKLKIGGEGMKGFYDQIIPKALEKIGKEHGVKVKQGEVGGNKFSLTGNGPWTIRDDAGAYIADFNSRDKALAKLKDFNTGNNIHYIDIPQSLRDTAMHKGFPLFSGGYQFIPVVGDPFESKKK